MGSVLFTKYAKYLITTRKHVRRHIHGESGVLGDRGHKYRDMKPVLLRDARGLYVRKSRRWADESTGGTRAYISGKGV